MFASNLTTATALPVATTASEPELSHQLLLAVSSWDSVDVALCIICIISLLLTIFLVVLLFKKDAVADEQLEADGDNDTENSDDFQTFDKDGFATPTYYFGKESGRQTIRRDDPVVEPGTLLLIGVLSTGKPAQYTVSLADITEKERFYIGRTGITDLCIKDSTISGIHAVLFIRNENEGMAICIIDNDSTNGTFVNNERLSGKEEQKLHHKDSIRLGQSQFTLYFPVN